MKKSLSIAIIITLLAALFIGFGSFSVGAGETEGYYTYTVSGGKATIMYVSTSISGDITVPSTLGGYPVTSIGYEAFRYCSNLTSITIPNSVTRIGEYAFYNCSNLTSITIGDSVTRIGEYAFEDCSKLTSITVDGDNTAYSSLGGVLFNKSKTTLVTYPAGKAATTYIIPNSVTSIGECAFYDCDGLTSITIPNSVTSIGDDAFEYCSNLTSITIGDGVTSIGNGAFYGCFNLTSITIPDGVKSIGGGAFYNCSNLTSITIPNSVKSIGDWAFSGCSKLTSITIPNSVTRIGGSAFVGCSNLTSITIPNSVTSIGWSAFNGCSKLTSITIPNSVKSIEKFAFYDCDGLTSITIPNGVTSIGSSAFEDCSNLTSITIPNSVKSIGSSVFEYCSNLTSITIPNSVKSIDEYAFNGCSKLVDVWYAGGSRSNIKISSSNEALTNATWHYGVEIVGEHVYDDTCDTTCNVCSVTRIAPHVWSGACDLQCNGCSQTRASSTKHTYSNGCDTSCNVCKATRTISHSYEKKVTKATLTANGKIQSAVCKVCGYTASTSKTTAIRRPYSFKLSTTAYTYNGAVKTPTVTVKDTAGKVLKKDTDYTVTYASGRKNVGTYTVKITMKGNYSGTKTLTFKINPIDISKCSVKLSATSYTYNGAVKTPSVVVKNAGGTTLTKNTHYTVTYASGRKNAGTYTVKVAMKGNYGGSKTLSFKINPISVSKCELVLSNTSYTYDGKSKLPSLTVLNHQGTKLTDSSYTVTYASGRKNVGTYKVTVKMKGNYSGTKTLTFKVNPAKTTVSKLTPATKSLKVSITKKSTQVTGYQIQYSTSKTFKSVKTVNISSYKTTSTTIKSLKAKTTYYVRVRTYKTVGGVKYYSGWSTVKYAKTK